METIWKDIPGYEGLYQASTTGDIKSIHCASWVTNNGALKVCKPKLMKFYTDRDGYKRIGLTKDSKQTTYTVHSVILKTFVGKHPEYNHVNHLNGDRGDNRLDNLEWVSPAHNVDHAMKYGLFDHRGTKNNFNKLSEMDVIAIRLFDTYRLSRRFELADRFNISRTTISNICNGTHWKWLK